MRRKHNRTETSDPEGMSFSFTTAVYNPALYPPQRSIETIVPYNPENGENGNKSMSISSSPKEE
jgi:hypothetical protein